MQKDDFFKFYSSDFLTGVSDLSMDERGQYITLLCLQHQKGQLTDKMINIAVGSVSVHVMRKFMELENGNYINLRLSNEIKKGSRFKKSRYINGSKPKYRKKEKFDFEKFFILNGFDEKLVKEYMAIRIQKNGVNTERKAAKIIEQIELIVQKYQLTKNEVLDYITSKEWSRFEAKWMEDDMKQKQNNQKDGKKNDASERAEYYKKKYNL